MISTSTYPGIADLDLNRINLSSQPSDSVPPVQTGLIPDESSNKIYYMVRCLGFLPSISEDLRESTLLDSTVKFEFQASDALKSTITKTDSIAALFLKIEVTLALTEKKADLKIKWKDYQEVTESIVLNDSKPQKARPPIMIPGERLDFIQIYPDTNISE